MAVTQADIDALDKAISRAEKIVKLDNKYVEYKSTEQMILARDTLQKQLNQATPRTRIVYYTQTGRAY
ncbi:phage head-tail joining protein [Undibacterium sp. Di26W]|uniref:phage head-tail joining protein n=1 Tax=Undibacterium sp. Di26W TaxID=3413035 RepID=UPI003BEF5709